MNLHKTWKIIAGGVVLTLLLICVYYGVLPASILFTRATETPFKPPSFTITPFQSFPSTPTALPTAVPRTIWIDPDLPGTFRANLTLPQGIGQIDSPQDATVIIQAGDGEVISRWIYALVAPFPTVKEGVSTQDIIGAWRGISNPDFGNRPLLMTQSTRSMLTALWGEPDPEMISVVSRVQLLDRAWDDSLSWAVVPFDRLEPAWKVLTIDGQSPLRKDFVPADYPLIVPISQLGNLADPGEYPSTNRDPDKLTTLVLTGVTALVRATAYTMEQQGITYPAQDIGHWLRDADFTHISNEVPFVQDCPYPDPNQKTLVFCSDPRYIELMEAVGTDVVELTGDHFGDWGPEAMLYTLELYQERGWLYYGGGADLEDARTPVKIEHNGNRLAFIGCNAKGGGYAGAAPGYPGAAACDFDYLTRQIQDLRTEGYLPIATFQHFEYYTYQAQPDQIRDARRLAEAGAVIVSGSQAHQPQAFQLTGEAFIHHGLGNLFFDQLVEYPPHTAVAFIDRHVFYQGKHLSTELLPIKFIDFARSRPMTPVEREDLLRTVFQASGW
ncbi:MAG: CapA family protein [Anaerolineales bacterium]|nr:CapA family protein [Anaerolineales bacterium]